MEYWEIIAWFFTGLFADNALGMLYAWKLGPERAERLVVASLLNEVVVKRIRSAWDFPTEGALAGTVSRELTNSEARLRDMMRAEIAKVPVPAMPTDIYVSREVEERIISRIASHVKKELTSLVDEEKKKLTAGEDPDVIAERIKATAEGQAIGDLLYEYGVPDSMIRLAESRGPLVLRALAMKYGVELDG